MLSLESLKRTHSLPLSLARRLHHFPKLFFHPSLHPIQPSNEARLNRRRRRAVPIIVEKSGENNIRVNLFISKSVGEEGKGWTTMEWKLVTLIAMTSKLGAFIFQIYITEESVCGDSSCEIYMGVSLAEFEGKI